MSRLTWMADGGASVACVLNLVAGQEASVRT